MLRHGAEWSVFLVDNTEWEHREAGNRQAGPLASRKEAKLKTAQQSRARLKKHRGISFTSQSTEHEGKKYNGARIQTTTLTDETIWQPAVGNPELLKGVV